MTATTVRSDVRDSSIWFTKRTRQRALYPRQKEALELYGLGLTYQEVADRLGVQIGTARSYIGGAALALGATDPKHAIELARAAGEIE